MALETSRPARVRATSFIVALVVFLWMPIFGLVLASFSASRFFRFPFDSWTTEWYEQAMTATTPRTLLETSVSIAIVVTIASSLLGFVSAMAFAGHQWRGRRTFQRVILLPLFLPQTVLGLALLLWFRQLDITPSWKTAAFAQTVWITPVVTVVVAIAIYGLDQEQRYAAYDLGASRLRTFAEITIPPLIPAIRSGALFAFILSWVNLSLSTYTTGADASIPEWIQAKALGGYTPLVPSIGVLSFGLPALTVGLIFLLTRLVRVVRPAHRF
ncbi:ABC transporter permease [soil metagenome]